MKFYWRCFQFASYFQASAVSIVVHFCHWLFERGSI